MINSLYQLILIAHELCRKFPLGKRKLNTCNHINSDCDIQHSTILSFSGLDSQFNLLLLTDNPVFICPLITGVGSN